MPASDICSNTTPLPRLVLDTNVVMDLFHFAAPPLAPLMAAITSGSVICLADQRTLTELERVTGYKQFKLDTADRQRLAAAYRMHVQLLTKPMSAALPPLPRCRDKDDQMFLEVALWGRADILISRDKLVLKLANARQRPCPFAILRPEQALQRLFGAHQA